jgi:hypothetical protein
VPRDTPCDATSQKGSRLTCPARHTPARGDWTAHALPTARTFVASSSLVSLLPPGLHREALSRAMTTSRLRDVTRFTTRTCTHGRAVRIPSNRGVFGSMGFVFARLSRVILQFSDIFYLGRHILYLLAELVLAGKREAWRETGSEGRNPR